MTDTGQVVVLGAGGHAKVVIGTLHAAGWDVMAIFDDRARGHGGTMFGVPMRGPVAEAATAGFPAVIGIGNNRDRQQISADLPLEWITVVHPRAWVDPTVVLGPGTVVFAGAVIQVDATVGAHVIVNTSATVDHDCVIGDFAHLAPGVHLAGGVRVGAGAFLGIGSSVIVGTRIGDWSTVGAGAAVIRDVDDGAVVVGVPARPKPLRS